jgi:hypothetical protein
MKHVFRVGPACIAAAAFLATAGPALAGTIVIGTTTVGSDSLGGSPTTAYGNVYTLGTSATAVSLSVYVASASSDQAITPIIYAAPGGNPGALAATGPQFTVTAGTTGWVTLPLNATKLAAGDYLIGLLFADVDHGIQVAATPFGTGATLFATTMSSDTTPDDPWPASQNYQDTLSAYATFSTGSSSGKKKVASIPQVNHVFLCYSKFQTDPGVWDSTTAAALLKDGYWVPYAIAGNVDGATNVGAFHLVCNLTGSQQPTGGFVDDGGGTWSADYASMPGLYPAAG